MWNVTHLFNFNWKSPPCISSGTSQMDYSNRLCCYRISKTKWQMNVTVVKTAHSALMARGYKNYFRFLPLDELKIRHVQTDSVHKYSNCKQNNKPINIIYHLLLTYFLRKYSKKIILWIILWTVIFWTNWQG